MSTWSGDGHFHASYRTHSSQRPDGSDRQATVPHSPGEATDRRRDVGRGCIRGVDRAGAWHQRQPARPGPRNSWVNWNESLERKISARVLSCRPSRFCRDAALAAAHLALSATLFPVFAGTAGPDAVFPAHSGNPNASVDLDHSMLRCSAGFLLANPRREFSLSCPIAARDDSGIAMLKAEFMYRLIVRLWGQETARILVGFYGSLSSDSSSDSASRAANKSSVVGSPSWGCGAITGGGVSEWCSRVADGCVAVWTCCKVRIATCV